MAKNGKIRDSWQNFSKKFALIYKRKVEAKNLETVLAKLRKVS